MSALVGPEGTGLIILSDLLQNIDQGCQTHPAPRARGGSLGWPGLGPMLSKHAGACTWGQSGRVPHACCAGLCFIDSEPQGQIGLAAH